MYKFSTIDNYTVRKALDFTMQTKAQEIMKEYQEDLLFFDIEC